MLKVKAHSPITTFFVVCIAIGCFCAHVEPASGQTVRRPRSVSASSLTPRFSPYLGLLRNDGGPLPNYFQFVRPQAQLLSTLQQQEREIQRGRQSLQTLNQRVDTFERQGSTQPTGIRGGFMQYSHFYPQLR